MDTSVLLLKNRVKTNPITVLGLVSLVLSMAFTQDQHFFAPLFPSLFGSIGLVILVWVLPNVKKVLFTLFAMVAGGIATVLLQIATHPAVILLLFSAVGLVMIGLWWWSIGKLNCRRMVFLLMAFGFILRLCYVLYTPVFVRQHDVWYFSGGDFSGFTYQRHGEYIEYIATYLELPSVNPTEVGLSQLYHPPLHHIIAGVWLKINTLFGCSYQTACENIQLLTLFYSSACMVIVYRILRFLGCKKWGLILPMAIVCLHPTFIIMAGSVNNDLLSITLALYAIYATLRWMKQPSMYHIICIALGVGCSMMTKLSGALVAPAIAVIFLWKWMQAIYAQNGSGQKLFWQFFVFSIICIPLGLWWPIKNSLAYDMPLTFVPALTENSGQFLGGYTLTQRLFGLESDSFDKIFMAWNHSGYTPYNEYNLNLALLKTSVFGEFTLFDVATYPTDTVHIWGTVFAKLLFWANTVLISFSLYAGVVVTIKNKKQPWVWLLWTVFLVVMFSYVQFCFAYPQACTANFRYAVPTLLCGCGFLGVYLTRCKKVLKTVIAIPTVLFSVGSIGCYALLGLV